MAALSGLAATKSSTPVTVMVCERSETPSPVKVMGRLATRVPLPRSTGALADVYVTVATVESVAPLFRGRSRETENVAVPPASTTVREVGETEIGNVMQDTSFDRPLS